MLPARSLDRQRSGRALRVLLVLVLVVCGLGLIWYATRAQGIETGPRLARGAEINGAADVQLEGERAAAQRGTARLVDPWATTSVHVGPGVRLAGDGRLAGRVLDRETGDGVSGVRVDLLPNTPAAMDILAGMLRMANVSEGMEKRSLPVAVTLSTAGGSFQFEGVRAGTYFLDARGPWHVPDHTVKVRVSPSGDGGPVDCFVRRGGRVVGQVVLPDGETPAARALVSLFPGPGVVVKRFREGDLRRLDTECDAEGRFVFGGVTPGEGYYLHAMGRGFAVSHLPIPAVRAGEDLEVLFATKQGATLEGRVFVAKGGDAAGEDEPDLLPLAGAQVAVLPQGLRDLAFAEEVLALTLATTDAEGRYRMRDVPLGFIEVLAVAPDHVSGQTPRIEVTAATTAPDIVLTTGPVLAGRVVGSNGQPVAGVHVRWFTGDVLNPETFDFSMSALMHQAVGDFRFPTSDADGRFLAGPFPGEAPYFFYLAKSGYPYTRVAWDPDSEGVAKEFVLLSGGAVEGVVVDKETRAPVTRFLIDGEDRIDGDFQAPSSFNPFSGGQLVENERGAFRVAAVKPGDEARLKFTAPGYHHYVSNAIEVQEGATVSGLVIELEAGGTISGRIVDRSGDPVAGAQVSVLGGGEWSLAKTFSRFSGHRSAGAYTDTHAENITNSLVSFTTSMGFAGGTTATSGPDGAFELQSVQAGSLAVVAQHRDYALGKSPTFELSAGENMTDVEVVMSSGAGLYGTVSDRFGRPVPDAYIMAVSPTEYSGDQSAEAATYQGTSDQQGNYTVDHMGGGSYLVTVLRGDEALDPMSLASTVQFDLVYVPRDERVRYDVVDRSAATCRVFGTVTTKGGPVTMGGIVAVSFEAENVLGLDAKAARVGSDATYEFPGLMPGSYQFVYQGGGSELRIETDVPDAPEFELNLQLPFGGITGRVVADDTGEPLSRCRVYLERAGRAQMDSFVAMLIYSRGSDYRVRTDEDGVFEFFGHQGGNYRVMVEPPRGKQDYAPAAPVLVEIEEGKVMRDIEVRVPHALSISGTVTSADGPVHRARVIAFPADGRPLGRTARTDPGGRFTIASLGSGDYQLVATADGYAESRSGNLALDDAPLDDVALTLTPGIELTVIVTGPSGQPVVGALASVFDASGRPVASDLPDKQNVLAWFTKGVGSDADGRLALGRFAAGTYKIEVWRGSARTTLEGVQLLSGPPREVEARLE